MNAPIVQVFIWNMALMACLGSGLGFPSLWVPGKVFIPARDTRKAKYGRNMLSGKES